MTAPVERTQKEDGMTGYYCIVSVMEPNGWEHTPDMYHVNIVQRTHASKHNSTSIIEDATSPSVSLF